MPFPAERELEACRSSEFDSPGQIHIHSALERSSQRTIAIEICEQTRIPLQSCRYGLEDQLPEARDTAHVNILKRRIYQPFHAGSTHQVNTLLRHGAYLSAGDGVGEILHLLCAEFARHLVHLRIEARTRAALVGGEGRRDVLFPLTTDARHPLVAA